MMVLRAINRAVGANRAQDRITNQQTHSWIGIAAAGGINMGMFDEFVLKAPVACPICGKGEFRRFQTKSLDCLLNTYHEGEIAGVKETRPFTKEEDRARIKKNMEDGLIRELAVLAGCLAGVPTGKIINILPDGDYPAYTYCKNCKEYFFVVAVVENGVFARHELYSNTTE